MRNALAVSLLLAAVVASAVAVVWTHHARRSLFIDLAQLEAHRDRLQVEWGRLQIEQSTWAANDRIERIAAEKLDLHIPSASAAVLVVADRGG